MLRFAEHLALRGLGLRSRQGYCRVIGLISRFHGCDPAAVDEEGLRRYFVHRKCVRHLAPKTMRQEASAAKYFYRGTLKRPCAVFDEIVAKDRESLPEVLTPSEVRRIFSHLRRRRYRTPLLLCYASGPRIGECVALCVDDVHGLEGKLLVRDGKGSTLQVAAPLAPAQEPRLDLSADWPRGSQPREATGAHGHGIARSPCPDSSTRSPLSGA